MADLQQVRARVFAFHDLFDAVVGIPHQQGRGFAVLNVQHQRLVVLRPVCRLPVPGCGLSTRICTPPKSNSSPAVCGLNVTPNARAVAASSANSGVGDSRPIPKLSRPEVRDHAAHSTNVIGVWVRDSDGVETAECRATRDRARRPPRRHRSQSATVPGTPPESSSRVLPSGVIISSESPCPTSIAVISSTPGCHSSVGGATRNPDAPLPAGRRRPTRRSSNRRRARISAQPISDSCEQAALPAWCRKPHVCDSGMPDEADRSRSAGRANSQR